MNRKLYLSFVLVILSLSASTQTLLDDPEGVSYFVKGTKLLQEGYFRGSDSLLSLALCSYKNENVYLNRGIARLYNNDTLGFCEDIRVAAHKYLDLDASKMYYSMCCKKVDTIFYNKDFIPVTNSKYKYYEVISESKYDKDFVGIFHQKGASLEKVIIDYGCNQHVIGLGFSKTDIIAVYVQFDSVKYYSLTPKPIQIFNLQKYYDIKEEASFELRSKYNNLKTQFNIDKVTVFFSITFSKTGEVLGIKYLGTFPEVQFAEITQDLEKDILQLVKNYPNVTPASFMKEKVNYIKVDSFEF